jgi:uncharacterized protein (DUF58 family)
MHTLTGRGRALVASGLVATGAGWGLGQPAITAVAVVLLLLPVLGILVVRRSRLLIGSARTVSPSRIAWGESAEVQLTVENASRLTSGVLLLEDTVPEELGEPARLVLDRVRRDTVRTERYAITGLRRGRTNVGPLTVTMTDPFGTAALTRSFTATNAVLVTPRIVPLGPMSTRRAAGGRGETLARALSAGGEDDLLPREHRPGDDMRRIHWPATARQGELMVRREEQAWHSALAVVLDDRESAHRDAGATFEWAVSAAASIALHYLRHGWRVTVLTTGGRLLSEAATPSEADIDLMLQAFAEARLSDHAVVASRMPEVTSAVVSVLGRLADEAVPLLARPTSGFAGALVLEPGPVDYLTAHGWRATGWSLGTSVADAWGRIAPLPTGARR